MFGQELSLLKIYIKKFSRGLQPKICPAFKHRNRPLSQLIQKILVSIISTGISSQKNFVSVAKLSGKKLLLQHDVFCIDQCEEQRRLTKFKWLIIQNPQTLIYIRDVTILYMIKEMTPVFENYPWYWPQWFSNFWKSYKTLIHRCILISQQPRIFSARSDSNRFGGSGEGLLFF